MTRDCPMTFAYVHVRIAIEADVAATGIRQAEPNLKARLSANLKR